VHPDEEITFIRIRSREHEIMIAPDKEYTMIVIQDDPSKVVEEK
jgi:dynein light chain roadblock-type